MSVQMTVEEWKKTEGIESEDQLVTRLEEIVLNAVCPVLCRECGDVEPDGHCEHGHPSILLALNLI
jgi:hypothetical protein